MPLVFVPIPRGFGKISGFGLCPLAAFCCVNGPKAARSPSFKEAPGCVLGDFFLIVENGCFEIAVSLFDFLAVLGSQSPVD